MDAFIVLAGETGGLVSLGPVYEALVAGGGVVDREFVRFGEWPLQILTDASPLLAEAIEMATEVEYGGVTTRVFRAEHLCAVALQTGEAGDVYRVRTFLEQRAVGLEALERVLVRYGLLERAESLLPSLFREGVPSDEYG